MIMMKRKPLWRLCCSILTVLVVLLLCVAAPVRESAAQRAKNSPAPQQKETVLFVVSGQDADVNEQREYSMDALAIIRGGKYLTPMDEYDDKSEHGFADKFFQKGQQYRLLFGGGDVGTATVKSWQEGCNTIHASVGVETSANIRGRIYGLATNSESLGNKPSRRRALTSAERASVMTLVNNIYRQHKTSAALMRQLKVNNLTAIDLNGDGQFEFVGDFVIQSGDVVNGARRDLFLIANSQGKALTAELASFQSYKMNSGFGHGVGFVDQLDIDGDGIGEVVTIDEGFDGYGYSIYKKQNGRWRSIHSASGDAC